MAQRAATCDDVLALAPELVAVKDRIPAWLALAEELISLRTWGTKASHAHALLTAHLVVRSPGFDQGTGGAVLASVTVGPVSKSYAVTASSDAELGSTSYGQAYMVLRRSLVRTPLAVNTRIRQ